MYYLINLFTFCCLSCRAIYLAYEGYTEQDREFNILSTTLKHFTKEEQKILYEYIKLIPEGFITDTKTLNIYHNTFSNDNFKPDTFFSFFYTKKAVNKAAATKTGSDSKIINPKELLLLFIFIFIMINFNDDLNLITEKFMIAFFILKKTTSTALKNKNYFSSISNQDNKLSAILASNKNKKAANFFSEKKNSAEEINSKNLKPLLFQYLLENNNQNGIGLDLKNNKLLNYNFKNGISNDKNHLYNTINTEAVEKKNWYLSEDLIKLISAFFKSIYCLISKPKFINTPDKLIIEILYYITIPNNNIFKWYNFIYNTKKIISAKQNNLSQPTQDEDKDKLDSFNKKTKNFIQLWKNKVRRIKKRNKFIRTILKKNYLIKKTLFKLNKTNITNLYFNKFLILFKLLNSYFKKPIEFNLIRLHKSDYDSNILAQFFFLILKKKNIKKAISKLFFKNKIGMLFEDKDINLVAAKKKNLAKLIPAYISGLYIQIGGRLLRERIVPKRTTKKFERGAIATGKVNFLDSARITKKNKKGAFTIKIAYAQNFRFLDEKKNYISSFCNF